MTPRQAMCPNGDCVETRRKEAELKNRVTELESALRMAERSLEGMIREHKGAWSQDHESLAAVKRVLGEPSKGEPK